MYNFKRPVLAIVLVIVLVVSSSACSPAPATQSVPISTPSNTEAAPVVSVDTNDGNYSYVVNGNDKLPKLKRLFGEGTVLTLVVQDLAGNELLRIGDVYRKTTNLNELLGAGEYKALFYDETGALLTPSQEVDDILTLKDRGKADTTSPS
ncbi:MAG: hypothetical protein IT315_02750, partial [Anaerolineales bacterium]|nr:hypothetical protein [Anaerolineales bacterium]